MSQLRCRAFSTGHARTVTTKTIVFTRSRSTHRVVQCQAQNGFLVKSLVQAKTAFCAGLLGATLLVSGAEARPEGVNRPELLPKAYTPVIDVAGFLTPSEERRIISEVEHLEADTGIKLRVLAQNYPDTPGLAIRDFWGVDDNTVVFVADPTFGDILNFNVGGALDLEVPQSFWTRLAGKYGNKFFLKEKGEAAAITNAVSAIDTCLREPAGKFKCSNVQGEFDEVAATTKKGGFGGLFGGN